MDLEAQRERLRALVAEMTRLTTEPEDYEGDEPWDMSDEDGTRFDEAEEEAAELRTSIAKAEERRAALAKSKAILGGDDAAGNRGAFEPPNQVRNDDAYDLSTLRFDVTATDLRARAATALEQDEITPDDVKERALATLRRVDVRGELANLFLHTGSKAYRGAFAKIMANQGWALDDAERQAMARAQSTAGSAGGFAVPFTLDPTIILTNDSAVNPMRRIARVETITTEDWNGVTSAGATASWDAEGAEVSDDSIILVQPTVPVHRMSIFVPFSVEIGGDWARIDSDLRMAMVDARDRLEANAHIKGTGAGQPTGIEIALDGTASELAPATAEVFAVADVYETQRQLPPRYRVSRDMPTWLGNLGTANDIRQFDTTGGSNFWTALGDGTPERLLGWQWEEVSEADDSPDINPAVTEDNFILYAGLFDRYVIVDRVGMQIELVPHLFGAASRPTGQRGLWGWLRTGADSIDDNAFRVMSIPTTL